MTIKLNNIIIAFLVLLTGLSSCKKETYSFGSIKTPTDIALTAVPAGATGSLPNGDGSGKVPITVTATNALTYTIDYGDGTPVALVPTGVVTHTYIAATTGNYNFNITINAIGTGGSISTFTKAITVYIVFQIPSDILLSLTGGTSKVWITDHNAVGHFGVGPTSSFYPDWYAAAPNTRDACAYDDEITFSADASNNAFISVDNKGETFIIGAATSFYGQSGGDGCYAIGTGGKKQLMFAPSGSGSTAAVSTQIQFTVPGNGIINFGTGATVYEILSITPTNLFLRNIGADGNAWYQKLIAK